MSSQVWYSKVWFEVDDDKYRYTFPWWVAGSMVGPLWLLWDAFFWVQTANLGSLIQKILAKVLISFCNFHL